MTTFEFEYDSVSCGFVCSSHGDVSPKCDLLLRQKQKEVPRKGKRPAVLKYYVLLVKCPVCNKYVEWEVKNLEVGL